MRPDEAPLERAVVFEGAAGFRLSCARRFVAALRGVFGPELIDVDLAATRSGPAVLVVARVRPAADAGEVRDRFLAQVQTDGGTAVALSELSFLERAEFLTRVCHCAYLRNSVAPAALEQTFEQLVADAGLTRDTRPATGVLAEPGFERRGAVRYRVDSPASVGPGPAAPALVENVSMTGAFVRTAQPAPLHAPLSLEIGLAPGHAVKVDATVVKVSATGMAVQFVPGPELQKSLAEGLLALSEEGPDPSGAAPEPREASAEVAAAGSRAAGDEAARERNKAAWDDAARERNKAVWEEAARELNKAAWEDAAREWNKAVRDDALKKRNRAIWSAAAREWKAQVREQVARVERDEAATTGAPPAPSAPATPDAPPAPSEPPRQSEAPNEPKPQLPPDPPVQVARLGSYELLSVLGRGGMGEVHFARATEGARAGQYVAIKRVLPNKVRDQEAVRLLLAEAEILTTLHHPNIVKAYEVGTFEGEPFIVMEALDGRDLRQLIRQCRQRRVFVPIDFTCSLFKSWLDALESLHRATGKQGKPLNLVHGDVSPHNLFISHGGEIKLADFGLSQPAGNIGAQRAQARGKPTYLSPEALDGEVSVATDLWAVAVTLYEVLCLEAPFRGDSFDELMKAIRSARPASARKSRSTIPAWLEAVLQRALRRKVASRYQSAAELGAALTSHLDSGTMPPAEIAAVVGGLFPKLKPMKALG